MIRLGSLDTNIACGCELLVGTEGDSSLSLRGSESTGQSVVSFVESGLLKEHLRVD